MNSKELIESGILESYALGIASDDERRQVEFLLRNDETIKAEYTQIEEAFCNFALASAIVPQVNIKSRVFNKLNFQLSPSPVLENKNTNWTYAIAACFAFLIASALVNYSLFKKIKTLNSENEKMIVAVGELKTQVNSLQKQHQKVIADLSSQLNRKIILKGVEKFPRGSVTVYWNEKTNEVTLFINNLPKPPNGKQYQLWALKDGVPIDAGMIDSNIDSAMQRMKDITGAQAFAITLEKLGGVPSPTVSEMYVMGNM